MDARDSSRLESIGKHSALSGKAPAASCGVLPKRAVNGIERGCGQGVECEAETPDH
jgi:hypothetical protein